MGRELASGYRDIAELWDTSVDGLIVTGTEPRSENLRHEPYWDELARAMEWAQHHTFSTVWSCLAAHAALLHFDGISRVRLAQKRFGVFECARLADHPLTSGLPERVLMPHSRWNDLPEDALVSAGYRLLTCSDEVGADTFAKIQGSSLFVFFQGHPEYEADTLMLEHRRDIGRFLRGEAVTFPAPPLGYFDDEVLQELRRLRVRAQADPHEELLTSFPIALATQRVVCSWRSAAIAIYRNWLTYLSRRKAEHRSAT
jgi:homoserine O-succinyltransferase